MSRQSSSVPDRRAPGVIMYRPAACAGDTELQIDRLVIRRTRLPRGFDSQELGGGKQFPDLTRFKRAAGVREAVHVQPAVTGVKAGPVTALSPRPGLTLMMLMASMRVGMRQSEALS